MVARVQVIVEAKDATGGILRGITSQFGALGGVIEELTGKNIQWGNLAATSSTLVVNGLKASIAATQEYGRAVRDQMLISKTGAEESSRFLQVLDDFELKSNDATIATKALTKQGLAPTIETIAQLADQYNQLNSAEERNQLIIKNLGRGGMEWANMLSQGGDKIRELNAGVAENLILTDNDVKAIERARLATDAWQDSIAGIQYRIGVPMLEALTTYTDFLGDHAKALDVAREAGYSYHTMSTVAYSAALSNAKAERETAAAIKQAGDAAKATEKDYSNLAKMTKQLKDVNAEAMAQMAYDNTLAALSVDGLTEVEKRQADQLGIALGVLSTKSIYAANQMDKLQAEFLAGTISAQEYAAALNSIPKQITTILTVITQNNPVPIDTGPLCFGEGTLIDMADGTQKKIEDVKVGDFIVSFDLEDNQEVYTRVEETYHHVIEEMKNGYLVINDIKVTPNHLLWVNEQWYEAEEVRIGDNLFSRNGYVKVKSVEFIGERIPTHNLHVAHEVHNYFAGGILAHNKRQSGGIVYAGQPTMVGERGQEPFIPSQNGRILGHAESLHALGMGGAGSNNYFYGNVTITADSEVGGDVLDIR